MDVLLDTLSIARGLREAGFSQQQAEALTDAVRSAASLPVITHLVTKNDLRIAIGELRAELRVAINEAKAETLKWVVGMILGSTLIKRQYDDRSGEARRPLNRVSAVLDRAARVACQNKQQRPAKIWNEHR
jgi:hypothetical protein